MDGRCVRSLRNRSNGRRGSKAEPGWGFEHGKTCTHTFLFLRGLLRHTSQVIDVFGFIVLVCRREPISGTRRTNCAGIWLCTICTEGSGLPTTCHTKRRDRDWWCGDFASKDSWSANRFGNLARALGGHRLKFTVIDHRLCVCIIFRWSCI